jgi:hypothetical protein
MSQITIKDVRAAWQIYCDVAKLVGFDPTGWQLQEGSSTTGVHFSGRTSTGNAVPGAIGYGFNSAYLGTTRRETYDALRVAASALRAVLDLRGPKPE